MAARTKPLAFFVLIIMIMPLNIHCSQQTTTDLTPYQPKKPSGKVSGRLEHMQKPERIRKIRPPKPNRKVVNRQNILAKAYMIKPTQKVNIKMQPKNGNNSHKILNAKIERHNVKDGLWKEQKTQVSKHQQKQAPYQKYISKDNMSSRNSSIGNANVLDNNANLPGIKQGGMQEVDKSTRNVSTINLLNSKMNMAAKNKTKRLIEKEVGILRNIVQILGQNMTAGEEGKQISLKKQVFMSRASFLDKILQHMEKPGNKLIKKTQKVNKTIQPKNRKNGHDILNANKTGRYNVRDGLGLGPVAIGPQKQSRTTTNKQGFLNKAYVTNTLGDQQIKHKNRNNSNSILNTKIGRHSVRDELGKGRKTEVTVEPTKLSSGMVNKQRFWDKQHLMNPSQKQNEQIQSKNRNNGYNILNTEVGRDNVRDELGNGQKTEVTVGSTMLNSGKMNKRGFGDKEYLMNPSQKQNEQIQSKNRNNDHNISNAKTGRLIIRDGLGNEKKTGVTVGPTKLSSGMINRRRFGDEAYLMNGHNILNAKIGQHNVGHGLGMEQRTEIKKHLQKPTSFTVQGQMQPNNNIGHTNSY